MRVKNLFYLTVFLGCGIAAGVGLGRYAVPLLRPAATPLPPVTSGDYRARLNSAGAPVVMFSMSTCPHCKDAHAYLASHGIVYADFVIDLSAEARKTFESMHENAVPVVMTANHLVRGFEPESYAEIFKQDGVLEHPVDAADRHGP